MLLTRRRFEEYIEVNRWIYDKNRLIPIDSQNPQRSKHMDTIPLNTLQPSSAVHEGVALGGRVTDGSLYKSSRIMTKQMQQEQQSVSKRETESIASIHSDDEDDDTAHAPETVVKKGAKTKKGKLDGSSTPAPVVWTDKMRKSLTTSVRKHKGKAKNKGINWSLVIEDMNLSKRDVMNEWKKIEKTEEDDCDGQQNRGNNSVPDKSIAVADEIDHTTDINKQLTVLIGLVTKQTEQIESQKAQLQLQSKQIEGQCTQIDQLSTHKETQSREISALRAAVSTHTSTSTKQSLKNTRTIILSSEDDDGSDEEVEVVRVKKKCRRGKKQKSALASNTVSMTEDELRQYGTMVSMMDENAHLKKEMHLRSTFNK